MKDLKATMLRVVKVNFGCLVVEFVCRECFEMWLRWGIKNSQSLCNHHRRALDGTRGRLVSRAPVEFDSIHESEPICFL